MPTSEPELTQTQPAWTDSPWFWLAMFAAMALAALVAVGPKYSQRQQGVERKFLAREEVARRRAGADLATKQPTDLLDAQRSGTRDEQRGASDEQADIDGERPGLIVPLWGLILLVSAVFVAAVVMLLRGRGSSAISPSAPNSKEIFEA